MGLDEGGETEPEENETEFDLPFIDEEILESSQTILDNRVSLFEKFTEEIRTVAIQNNFDLQLELDTEGEQIACIVIEETKYQNLKSQMAEIAKRNLFIQLPIDNEDRWSDRVQYFNDAAMFLAPHLIDNDLFIEEEDLETPVFVNYVRVIFVQIRQNDKFNPLDN